MATDFAVITETLVAEENSNSAEALICRRCGEGELQSMMTRSAFWDNDRLVVIEDVPALVCASCQEQHYSDETVVRLDLLRGQGFPDALALRHMNVPVFRLMLQDERDSVA
jgi:YgiT-type zinc finger domain-containing protein